MVYITYQKPSALRSVLLLLLLTFNSLPATFAQTDTALIDVAINFTIRANMLSPCLFLQVGELEGKHQTLKKRNNAVKGTATRK